MLILGTAQLRSRYGVVSATNAPLGEHAAGALLERARELGVDALDTAPSYSDAESFIGRSGFSGGVHTKLDPSLPPVESLRRSLARLRRNSIDVLYFHVADVLRESPGLVDEAIQLVGDEVRRLGVSVYEPEDFRAVVDDGRFGVVQVPMSVIDRRLEADDLIRARDRDVWVIVRSVFLQGLVVAPIDAVPDRLSTALPYLREFRNTAARFDVDPMRVAVSWVRDRPGIEGAILGTASMAELEEIVAAWRSPPLPRDLTDAIGRMALAPAWLCDPRQWPRPS